MSILPAWQRENRKPRILIVDDDFEIAEPVRFALEGLQYHVIHKPDGLQGAKAVDEFNPDLMVLDMMMPGQSGFLVLEHLRRTMRTQIRVIMVTGNEGERHKNYAKMLGADDYIHKPFAMDRLLQSVERLLNEPFPDGTESTEENASTET